MDDDDADYMVDDEVIFSSCPYLCSPMLATLRTTSFTLMVMTREGTTLNLMI